MKLSLNQIPFEGLNVEEEVSGQEFDLDTELIKFSGPIKVRAKVTRITNAVTAAVNVRAKFQADCSRCLKRFESELIKDFQLNYPADKDAAFIDLDPDIREEVILDYPIKLLCDKNCKGLCVKCGKNLNEVPGINGDAGTRFGAGGCNCGST